jgi:anti-sigma-K factor RskA
MPLAFLLKHWKLAGYVLAAAAISLLAWRVSVWREGYKALPAAQQALEASQALRVKEAAQWAAEAARIASVNEGLTNENETLRAVRAATPVRSVRLCSSPAAARSVAPATTPAPSGNEAPAGAGELQEAAGRDLVAGPDIGPSLYALMDEADEVVKSCRALQGYVEGLPK